MAQLHLLFTGDAEIAPTAAEVASAEPLVPAAVEFFRSAPDVERKPAGKVKLHAKFNFGKILEQQDISPGEQVQGAREVIPHNTEL